jgi:ketosteroid isomerase-like protein
MRKIIAIIVLFIFVQTVNAQKGIDNLIQAEKNFAAYSVAHSTKEAFLKVMDSSSVMFENGKPVKGIEFWNKREKNTSMLNWRPQYAEISASEDFGYTTGPWTFQNSVNDPVSARGQYITVWHLDKNGEWKFLVDFGINNKSADSTVELRIIDVPKQAGNEKVIPHIAPLVAAENNFNKLFAQKKSKAYKTWLSKESILNRNGFLPAVISTNRLILIDSTPMAIKYSMNDWGISPVPDMGYTYGTTIINGKTENYLRIWRREKTGWKIAVEVLRY